MMGCLRMGVGVGGLSLLMSVITSKEKVRSTFAVTDLKPKRFMRPGTSLTVRHMKLYQL